MLSLTYQSEKRLLVEYTLKSGKNKGSDYMPTLEEFKENLLALLDVVNSK